MGWPNTVYVDIPSPYEGLVQYCRCPHCGFVWGHLEIPDRTTRSAYVESHYGGPTQCEYCHQWSIPNPRRNRYRRQAIPDPNVPQPEPPPKRVRTPWWRKKARQANPVTIKDHEQEEER